MGIHTMNLNQATGGGECAPRAAPGRIVRADSAAVAGIAALAAKLWVHPAEELAAESG